MVIGDEEACDVCIELQEAEPVVVNAAKTQAQYQTLLQASLDELSVKLRLLDTRCELMDPAGRRAGFVAESETPSRQVAALARRVRQSEWLPISAAPRPVRFVAGEESTELDSADVEVCVSVASMIANSPRTLTPEKRQAMADLAVRLRRACGGAESDVVTIPINGADRVRLELLYRQAQIRQRVPVREILRCRDCGWEKVTNPDYQKRLASQRRTSAALGIVAAAGTMALGNVNPFRLASRVFTANNVGTNFSCSKCQGTAVEMNLAAICPSCHKITRRAILRNCRTPECAFDYSAGQLDALTWASLKGHQDAQQCRTVHERNWLPSDTGAPSAGGPPSMAAAPPPGWYPDPSGRFPVRWFDDAWTEWASGYGGTVCDPF